MASLTETAYYARRGVKFGTIGFVVLLILWWTGTGLVNFWQATHPEPPPPPAASFGALPPIEFPESKMAVNQFTLQTPAGNLGTFPDRLQIFVAPAKKSSFLAPDNAAKLAAKLGFTSSPTLETSTLYRWSIVAPLPSILEMDIINTQFTLRRNWSADPTIITNKRFVSEAQSILDARTFLTVSGLISPDLLGQEKATFLRTQGDQFIPAISLSESDFVKVDFFRSNYTPIVVQLAGGATKTPTPTGTAAPNFAFYTPDPSQGIVTVITSGASDEAKKIIDVNYRYTPIEYESFSDYPLKTVQQAWDELNSNQGYIASYTGGGQAVVRRVNLGYFDPLTPHQYIMPIYVFTGDDNLVAYVSALSDSLIQR